MTCRPNAPVRLLVAGVALAAGLLALPGCTLISYLGTDSTGEQNGKTYYLGGAGTFGHVGTIDVPNGLREAGYRGATEVFGWQSIVGGTIRDQVDRARNEEQALRLTTRIREYLDRFPGRRVNIIALSAGTGITAWALEMMPEGYSVGTVVFLGSSLSRTYDLTSAMRRIDGKLYNFYSPNDPILRYGVPIAGTVDRDYEGSSAGLAGFTIPVGAGQISYRLYADRLRNMPYRSLYARYGYQGRHTDSTSPAFVQRILFPLINEPLPKSQAPPANPAPPGPPGPPTEKPPTDARES